MLSGELLAWRHRQIGKQSSGLACVKLNRLSGLIGDLEAAKSPYFNFAHRVMLRPNMTANNASLFDLSNLSHAIGTAFHAPSLPLDSVESSGCHREMKVRSQNYDDL